MTSRPSPGPDPVDRRTFLKVGALSVGAIAAESDSLIASTATAPAAEPAKLALIDVNIYLSQWPFRRLPGDETPEMVSDLRAAGVTQAWAGSFDSVLHRDIAAVNARLADECRKQGDGLLIPFGTVNPTLPDWQEDLRRCHEVHRMPGLRLHPNYHGYKLDNPAFAELLDLAEQRNLIVQIALSMEDERTQHPLMLVKHVDPKPLLDHAKRRPNLRIVLVNSFRALPVASIGGFAALPNVAFEIAMLEGCGGVATVLEKLPANRVLFGSYAPFFYFESAALKLRESPLSEENLQAIASGNAKALLART